LVADCKQGQGSEGYQLKVLQHVVLISKYTVEQLSSTSFICSVTVGISGVQYPVRLQRRRMKDSSLLRFAAETVPRRCAVQDLCHECCWFTQVVLEKRPLNGCSSSSSSSSIASAVLAIPIPSVRLSVCLSHAGILLCQNDCT